MFSTKNVKCSIYLLFQKFQTILRRLFFITYIHKFTPLSLKGVGRAHETCVSEPLLA
jgi:hypothetical protein